MMKGIWIPGLIFAILFSMSFPALADMTWTEETRSELLVNDKTVEKEIKKARIKLKTGGVRIDDLDEGSTKFCNLTSRSCVVYYSSTHSFDVISSRDIARAAAEEDTKYERSLRKEMSRAPGMPEKERAAIQAELDGIKARKTLRGKPFDYKATGERAEIEGHPCRKYIGGSKDEYYMEVWIAENIKPETGFFEYSRFLAICDPVNYRFYGRIPGFPIKVVLSYGPLKITTQVKNLSEKRVGVSEFILPAGAKKSSPP